MIATLRHQIARWRFRRIFAATLPACERAVSKAARQHRRPDPYAVKAQREALHRALAHGRARA